MVPDGMLRKITETMVAFGGIANVAEVITTADGQSLRWPSNDDTGNAADLVAEGSATAAGADLVFGETTLGAYSYDASGAGNLPLKLSKELIQDAAFDIEGYVAKKLGERLARKMAAAYATGTGVGQPKGLFALSADVMTATTLLAAFTEHLFQIDASYREAGNCRWVFSDTTLAKVYGSVDLNGRPLFIPSADAGGSGRPTGTVLGYPVTLDQGAGSLVAFGDIAETLIIRKVRGITVDVDPYSYISTRQVGFHAWARTDSAIQNTASASVSEYSTVSADATA
jgi:HK97 family phage major capsid protein